MATTKFTADDVGPYRMVGEIQVLMTPEERQIMSDEWNANSSATQVPQSVTMRQARLALLSAGKLSAVENLVNSMQGAQGDSARIEWNYSNEVKRNQSLTLAIASAIGMTGKEMDDLFVEASKL